MTRDRDMTAIVQRFRQLNPDYLVVTKIDETGSFGALMNVAVQSQLPLSYFTMGQRVPEDMEVATKERVADLLLNVGA
jgi:flagellar biosynthesis protein FlhF